MHRILHYIILVHYENISNRVNAEVIFILFPDTVNEDFRISRKPTRKLKGKFKRNFLK